MSLPPNNFKCELCDQVMSPYWILKDANSHEWSYVRCDQCGLVRLAAESSDSEWQKLAYAENYYGDGFSKFSGAIQMLREFSAWRRAREIHGLFKKPGRVLDIGCGEGLFLKSMKSFGWTVDGCEIGERAADRAEQNLGQKIHRGNFETMSASQPWDVVMLWHVLEHISNLTEFLKKISNVMNPSGLLVIAIPNADSWQAKCFGQHWFHLDPPRHFYNIGLQHLEKIASLAGWKVEEHRHFSLEYNPFGWAQSFLNSLGWRRDAMYETLKRRRKLDHPGFALRVLAWLLLGPSITPAVVEAVVGKGGCTCSYLRSSNDSPVTETSERF